MKYNLIAERNNNYTAQEQILVNRGIPFKDINNYLRTTDDVLIDPRHLDNVEDGIKLLLKHLKNDSKIFLQVDSDVDGYTSSALLYNYLYKLFPSKIGNITFRVHDGKEHGVILDTVMDKGYDLIILPDSSSNQYEEHKTIKEAGMDILIIDHHECEKESEYACVINNQLSESYTNKDFCAVGIVYKFCKLIDELTKQTITEGLLDLVSLGNIADMMDTRSFETRHFISKGLANIQNPFFKGLVERQAYSIGATITPIGVAFYIAPLINATIRVGTEEEKITMFKALLEPFAYELVPSTKRGCKGDMETIVEQAIRNAVNIKNRQKKMRDDGVAQINETIEKFGLDNNQVIIVKTNGMLDKNLTGLVANQVMARLHKPVLLLRETEEMLQGSGRGYDKSEFNEFKSFLQESGLFEYAEGHQNAFGCGIKEENVAEFIEMANDKLAKYDFNSNYEVDFVYEANDIKLQEILDISNMKALWGKGVDEAYVVIKNVKVNKDNIKLMSPDRNPTIKIELPGLSMIKFGASSDEYEALAKETGYVQIDVCGKCSVNEWQGNITPQILIQEYIVTDVASYYF